MKKHNFIKKRRNDTSWQGVAKWYNKSVGEKGHYFHQNVILPKVTKLLDLDESSSVLDLGCGQGVLARYLPKNAFYHGFDLSEDLIRYAKTQSGNNYNRFDIADVSNDLKIKKNDFSHATIILALQNIENYRGVFANASRYLRRDGKFLIVINHPYFRIPRQSSWEIDQNRKIQYRRIDRYLSPLKIPINMNPGLSSTSNQRYGNHERNGSSLKQSTKLTWSFHNSLQDYTAALQDNDFVIEKIEEWTSDKNSEGKAAKMENRAREEFPMFMAILCRKIRD